MPERMDVRQLFRRSLYDLIRGAADSLCMVDLCTVARVLGSVQEWLHVRRILRYPRNLRRLHSRIVEMGLARPASEFDPSQLPARRDTDHCRGAAALQAVVERCETWLSPRGRYYDPTALRHGDATPHHEDMPLDARTGTR
jgi:hypothetical protein